MSLPQPDPLLLQLPLGVFVSVEAQLGIVGKVCAELQEDWTKVSVHAVDIELVHHGGGSNQPWIRSPGFFIPPSLGPKQTPSEGFAPVLLRASFLGYYLKRAEIRGDVESREFVIPRSDAKRNLLLAGTSRKRIPPLRLEHRRNDKVLE